ncbi:hypothetical protein [uncultured Desulfovibrio sp.]|uniref:hypothetical protein n=1 Tax=uncultured Desulfovibrio sp. TaxID=167968 RepID=UPI002625CD2B|nr:hypothetical protein [uncultured Desulfovibrio sp.]
MNAIDPIGIIAIGIGLGGSGLMFWAAYKQGALARRIDLFCGWVFGLSCAATVGLVLNFVK